MSKITIHDSKVITEIVSAANLYRPTADQRQVKAEFHMAAKDGPVPKTITAAFAVQITGRSVLEKWWALEGFRDWFLDNASFDNEAEALASAALEVIGNIMYTSDKDSDRLSAAKMLIEIAGKVKKNKVEVRFLDESIPDSVEELDKYIAKAGGKIEETQ